MSPPSQPRRLTVPLLNAIHADQIRLHGGAQGIRDSGRLESALQRAPNHWRYEPAVDLPYLGALYGVGLARNHPFVDGNKRVAFMATYVFLGLNGLRINAPEAAVVTIMLDVATGDLQEDGFAQWLRDHTVER